MLGFIEKSQARSSIPSWVGQLVSIGAAWPSSLDHDRRIALLTMPSDSPAVGLLALGALIADLKDISATDLVGHYSNLLKYAKQHANHCSVCTNRCNPNIVRCGYLSEADGRLRKVGGSDKRYMIRFSPESEEIYWELPGRGKNGPIRSPITPSNAINYYPSSGFSPSSGLQGLGINPLPYTELLPDNRNYLEDNLRTSFSGLCIASHSQGAATTKAMLESYKFIINEARYNISDLLRVAAWIPRDKPSRCQLYNTRTGKLDKPDLPPRVVITHGDNAFLAIISNRTFQHSHIIGVINRSHDRDRLDNTALKLSALHQWYRRDTALEEQLDNDVPGIELLVLRRGRE